MIETVFTPRLFIVTILAFDTKTPLVPVIMGMAGITIRLDLDLEWILFMTTLTGHVAVTAT